MIIEIESYERKNLYLSGGTCSGKSLRDKMNHILAMSNGNFVELFCRIYGFERVPDGVEIDTADFVIDLDTYIVYKPKY